MQFTNKNKVRHKRIAGNALQRIRAAHFRRNPLCVHCAQGGRVELAVQLDHIIPLEFGGHDVEANRQGLCVRCHLIKTARDRGLRLARKIGLDGFPVDEMHAHKVHARAQQPRTSRARDAH